MNISVIGFGIYSVALSLDMNENGHNVKIWSERNDDYKNKKDFAPILDMAIPEGISISNDIKDVLTNADLIVICTASKYVREVCISMKKYYNRNKNIIKIELGFSNSNEFKEFVKTIQQLKGNKLKFEKYRILRTTVVNENNITSAYLGITYSNNEEIIINTKLSNEINQKETSITYSFEIENSKIEKDNQKQKILDKELENTKGPFTRGSPIE